MQQQLLFVGIMMLALSTHSGAPHKKRVADALDAARALTETEPAAALDTADALLRRYPALGDAHYQRGLALWKLQRTTEATDALDRAVELEPTSAVFLDERGVAAGTLGDDMRAYSFFRRAVAADPDFLRSRSNLAYSLLQLRRDAEARVQLQAALILDPTHHLSRTRLEQLDTVAENTVSVPVVQVCCCCRRLKGFVSVAKTQKGQRRSERRRAADAKAAIGVTVARNTAGSAGAAQRVMGDPTANTNRHQWRQAQRANFSECIVNQRDREHRGGFLARKIGGELLRDAFGPAP